MKLIDKAAGTLETLASLLPKNLDFNGLRASQAGQEGPQSPGASRSIVRKNDAKGDKPSEVAGAAAGQLGEKVGTLKAGPVGGFIGKHLLKKEATNLVEKSGLNDKISLPKGTAKKIDKLGGPGMGGGMGGGFSPG